MNCLYFDCFAGISGDMTMGALVDLGLPRKHLSDTLGRLDLTGYSLKLSRAMRMGISARTFNVVQSRTHHKHTHHHRSYADIEKMIVSSALSPAVKERSLAVFTRIARAEALIHNRDMAEVHFHEVGALDSIVDIVGSAIGLEYFGIDCCLASELPLGHGFVQCQHGTLPVPAPATLKILEGVPVYDPGITAELVTPTGAAIVAEYARNFGPMPAMTIQKSGYGAGSRELHERPNVLRLILGTLTDITAQDCVRILEASIDDMNPEWAGYLMERLFAAGALDVAFLPAQMKKNRPGLLVQIICREEDLALLSVILFQESTTAGVRSYRAERRILLRRAAEVRTRYGTIRVKLITEGKRDRVVPEYEDCRRAALKAGVPLQDVYGEAARGIPEQPA
jgi:pyridinium-3,5-bisthiocarboxylic acid mononucleotide nickel chelatase